MLPTLYFNNTNYNHLSTTNSCMSIDLLFVFFDIRALVNIMSVQLILFNEIERPNLYIYTYSYTYSNYCFIFMLAVWKSCLWYLFSYESWFHCRYMLNGASGCLIQGVSPFILWLCSISTTLSPCQSWNLFFQNMELYKQLYITSAE